MIFNNSWYVEGYRRLTRDYFLGTGDANNNKTDDSMNNEKKFLKVEKATNEQITLIAPVGILKSQYESKLIGMKDMILVSQIEVHWNFFIQVLNLIYTFI